MPKPITSTNTLEPGRTILVQGAGDADLTYVLFIGWQGATQEFIALRPNGDIESLGSFASWRELEEGPEADWLRAQSNWNDAIIHRAVRRLAEGQPTSEALVYDTAPRRSSRRRG